MLMKYVYRIDTIENFKKIKDETFRAKVWYDKEGEFPHKLLRSLCKKLGNNERIFRICFFSTENKAIIVQKEDYKFLGPSYIFRCPKSSVKTIGFNESWDDGFENKEAYLFWNVEINNDENSRFSSLGINFKEFEIFIENGWKPLNDYLNDSDVLSVEQKGSIELNISDNKKNTKKWWKFWTWMK